MRLKLLGKVITLNEWRKTISKLVIETFLELSHQKKLQFWDLHLNLILMTQDTLQQFQQRKLLENGANLFIHDPQVNQKQICNVFKETDNNFGTKLSNSYWTFTKDLRIAFEESDT